MRQAARIQAVIELLDAIEVSIVDGGRAADAIVTQYFRDRRYAGSKDRRFIRDMVFDILRQREKLLWSIEMVKTPPTARLMVLIYLKNLKDTLDAFGVKEPHAPAAISKIEAQALSQLAILTLVGAPWYVEANVPSWAAERLKNRFQDDYKAAAELLNDRAALSLRVNTLKTDRDTQAEGLSIAGYLVHEGVYADTALIADDPIPLANVVAYREGMIEVQDEAAQIASKLVQAETGHRILDLCAGAGGKSLAIAAEMGDDGVIIATDIDGRRLQEAEKRASRAGASSIEIKHIKNNNNQYLEDNISSFDRVIIDAPCSGSGTWRRTVDIRWRFDDARLEEVTQLQAQLLKKGAAATKVGGHLLYMTCSLFKEENEAIVDSFLSEYEAFEVLAWESVWDGENTPKSMAANEEFLLLAPHMHGTDGFFVAIMKRIS